jgi:1,4-alpha-glucan branching enzyme
MNSQATNHKDNQQNPSGYLAILLHAHLPFVRHPEHPSFLEEDWLFEAITETYVPLLDVFNRLRQDDVDFRITMSITPTLCEMLADPLLQGRYASRLTHLREFCSRELARTEKKPELHRTARMYAAKLARIAKLYEEDFDRDLISQFRRLQDAGNLEIITCAATHGFLPLFSHPACIRAQ